MDIFFNCLTIFFRFALSVVSMNPQRIQNLLHDQGMNEMLDVIEFEELINREWVRQPVMRDRRADHMHVLNDAEFRRTFRFSKDGVDALVLMLHDQLSFDDGCNDPVTPLQQVLVALYHYAGGHFQRTSALCAGISQPTACRIIHHVSRALCEHKAEHIYMP
jgi:hypothetical protein